LHFAAVTIFITINIRFYNKFKFNFVVSAPKENGIFERQAFVYIGADSGTTSDEISETFQGSVTGKSQVTFK